MNIPNYRDDILRGKGGNTEKTLVRSSYCTSGLKSHCSILTLVDNFLHLISATTFCGIASRPRPRTFSSFRHHVFCLLLVASYMRSSSALPSKNNFLSASTNNDDDDNKYDKKGIVYVNGSSRNGNHHAATTTTRTQRRPLSAAASLYNTFRRSPTAFICLVLTVIPEINIWRGQYKFHRIDPSSAFAFQPLPVTPAATDGRPAGQRVAIVVAGSLERFQLNASVHHLLRPLTQQGHAVDYYLSLTTSFSKTNRRTTSAQYTDRVHWDAVFSNGTLLQDAPTEAQTNNILRHAILQHGGRLRQAILRDFVSIDGDEMLREHRRQALQKHPKEDPDMRFPSVDVRNDKVEKRTAAANRSLLRHMLATYELWKALLQVEATLEFQYDYVMFLRDDTLWIRDFDLNKLLNDAAISWAAKTKDDYNNKKNASTQIDVYALACDARDPPLDATEMNDYGLMVHRSQAQVFGTYYLELFRTDLKACAARLPRLLSKDGQRGCNAEMILKWIVVDQKKLKVYKVGQQDMPFQRGLTVILKDGVTLGQCLHQTCQSRKNQLNDTAWSKCQEMTFT